MPRVDYKRCKVCGRPAGEVGPLSHARLCGDCADDRLVENVIGMATMTNPARDRWRRAMAASVGAVLLDEPALSVHTEANVSR